MEINQYDIDMLLNCIKSNTYVCNLCDKAIIPNIHLSDNTINIVAESADIRGAHNKRLKRICTDCAKAMSLHSDLELTYKFGDILNYKPLTAHTKTKCLFIREEGNKAIVIFENAEVVSRVGFNYLEKAK